MKNQNFLKRLGYAANGLGYALRNEASFRTQVILGILVFLALGILGAEPLWWAVITLCVMMVWTAELFNTALEAFVDHIHPAQHSAIAIVKDCAAGAVLISSLLSILVFAFYLAQRFHLL